MLADLLLALAAFLGHFALAVWIYNRLHAIAGPVRLMKLLEKLVLVTAAAILGVYLGLAVWKGSIAPPTSGIPLAYTIVCWVIAALIVPLWLVPKLLERVPAALLANDAQVIDIAAKLGQRPIHGVETWLFAAIPGNQLLQLHVQTKTLHLPTLPPELDGIRIAHLSDLHMIGDLTEDFYREVVEQTNALDPDLICITGDILEKHACLPWIGTTLGQLRARHGKFFILGNHEQRLGDVHPLRDALIAAGLTDLGSRTTELEINGTKLLLAGNELPWFGSAPLATSPQPLAPSLRILLAHTPDQYPWARQQAFPLMLAGHNHGGQIRLPWLGALITPSWYGWRYAGGLYHEPPTLLHVSRGISGKHPIRLNCPPELALLVLKADRSSAAG